MIPFSPLLGFSATTHIRRSRDVSVLGFVGPPGWAGREEEGSHVWFSHPPHCPTVAKMVKWILLSLVLWEGLRRAGAAAASGMASRVEGLVGSTVLLEAEPGPGFHVRDVIWRRLCPSEELVATFFGGSAQTLYRSRFLGRARLLGNLSLEVRRLERADSSNFSLLLVDAHGQVQTRTVQLHVYEAVSKPTVQVFMAEAGGSRPGGLCHVFLACDARNGSDVAYSWRREAPGGPVGGPPGDPPSVLEGGRVLRVSLPPGDRDASFSCVVANPVSRHSTAVTPWDHCLRGPEAEKRPYWDIMLVALPVAVVLLLVAVITLRHCTFCSGSKRKQDLSSTTSSLDTETPQETPSSSDHAPPHIVIGETPECPLGFQEERDHCGECHPRLSNPPSQ
ncbi:SLAM family member 8 [Ornithorhynchus anatinus]|uniref:SLAM family member 8 n=1 Tax=Ornithorhynchus anatinus TaxID=9258 RepID=A0A6I8NN74_ORNAN|nr:SLAM family member 8 [Ornithorhynchus anatinus]